MLLNAQEKAPTAEILNVVPGVKQRGRAQALQALCIALLLIAVSLPSQPTHAQSAPTHASLYVYVHSLMKPRALAKAMERSLPGVGITVFGRLRDFQKALKNAPPDAAISYQETLVELKLSVTMQGTRSGKASTTYVMVSQSGSPLPSEDVVVGIVELLSRRSLTSFARKLVQSPSIKSVKLATKREDLLGLLRFKLADGILVPHEWVRELKSATKMSLVVTPLNNANVMLIGATIFTSKGKSHVGARLSRLPKELVSELGVDSWKTK